jgi:hypothetical protein
MRRTRIIRKHSSLSLVGTAGVAALAGFVLGALFEQKLGGVVGVRAGLRRYADGRRRDRDEPGPWVYEMDGLTHDDSDDEAQRDEIVEDESDTRAAVELEERVLNAFLNDPVLREADVEISAADNGLVTLRGRLASREEVQHAATIAGGVPGVAGVANSVRVRRSRRSQTR